MIYPMSNPNCFDIQQCKRHPDTIVLLGRCLDYILSDIYLGNMFGRMYNRCQYYKFVHNTRQTRHIDNMNCIVVMAVCSFAMDFLDIQLDNCIEHRD